MVETRIVRYSNQNMRKRVFLLCLLQLIFMMGNYEGLVAVSKLRPEKYKITGRPGTTGQRDNGTTDRFYALKVIDRKAYFVEHDWSSPGRIAAQRESAILCRHAGFGFHKRLNLRNHLWIE
jgi:hypothetical protein